MRQPLTVLWLACLGWTLCTGAGCQSPTPASTQTPADEGAAYNDPTRFEKAIRAFEASDGQSPPPSGAVVCVGSSSMRMWHGQLAEDLEPLTVIGQGFGGSNMNDLLYYLERVVLNYKPRAVVIYEGDNDLAQGISPTRIAQTFDLVVERIHAALPGCRIYVLSIKPSPARWALWPKMAKANHLLALACAADGRLTYLDIATPMLGADGRPRPELFVKDQLHMTPAGYTVWRSAVRPVLVENERAFERPVSPDSPRP